MRSISLRRRRHLRRLFLIISTDRVEYLKQVTTANPPLPFLQSIAFVTV